MMMMMMMIALREFKRWGSRGEGGGGSCGGEEADSPFPYSYTPVHQFGTRDR